MIQILVVNEQQTMKGCLPLTSQRETPLLSLLPSPPST
jgi:hypothetical protein